MKFDPSRIIDEDDFFKIQSRNCGYRNCINVIPNDRRSDSKYCCNKCKENERTYLKREKRRFRKEKLDIKNMLIDYDKNKDIIDLFNQIYSKKN